MVATPNIYQLGDLVRVKTEDGALIGQPSDDAKGKSGKILRRYVASTQRISTVWWVGFEKVKPELIAKEWLEPELTG